MTITNEQRDQAYEAATPQQRFLYAAPQSGRTLWVIAEKYALTESTTYSAFVEAVGDVVLQFEKQTNLPTLLVEQVGVTFEQAIKITGELIDFLQMTPPGTTPPFAPPTTPIAPPTLAQSYHLASTPVVPTYTTTQAAILREGEATQPAATRPTQRHNVTNPTYQNQAQPPANLPQSQPPTEPRWGDD